MPLVPPHQEEACCVAELHKCWFAGSLGGMALAHFESTSKPP
jgi:hypothetical protein